MKKVIAAVIIMVIALVLCLTLTAENKNDEYVRIHIRANSNDTVDQTVKLRVRDSVVEYLTPLLANVTTARDAKRLIASRRGQINTIANEELRRNGFLYSANTVLKREEFPARSYGKLTLEAGSYDALIIELGEGDGDNWWCVAFPPLCFVPDGDVEYKSKIWEIIRDED